MKTSVRRIAAEYNVSPATVSLVLNNKPGVREETRMRIAEALVRNGYQIRNRSEKRRIQYICYQGSGWFTERPDSFYSYILKGLDEGCKQYETALNMTYATADTLEEIVGQAKRESVDGIIFLGTEINHNKIPACLNGSLSLPIVVLDNPLFSSRINCIYPDDFTGLNETIMYLKDLGHREIGFVSIDSTFGELYNREMIWRRVIAENGLGISAKNILHLKPSAADAQLQFAEYLQSESELPTAFMTVNDVLGTVLISSLTAQGFRVPEDVSVIGYDNSGLCMLTTPNLTSISSDVSGMGRAAVRRLLELIANRDEPCVKSMVETRLVVRDSAGPAHASR